MTTRRDFVTKAPKLAGAAMLASMVPGRDEELPDLGPIAATCEKDMHKVICALVPLRLTADYLINDIQPPPGPKSGRYAMAMRLYAYADQLEAELERIKAVLYG